MAAPTYATDLADITLCEALGTWVETGTWTTGTAPALEPDFFIQGSNCIAKYWTSGGGGGTASGAIFDAASALTIPSPGAFFVWMNEQCPNNIGTEANGGLRVIMGDSASAFNGWTVGGSDTYKIGGWFCAVVDPAVTKDYTVGSPVEDSTRQWFGVGVLQTATAKGGLGCDALRYGRGEFRCTNGDVTNGYASFGGSSPDAGAAAYDSNSTRAWGMLTPTNGVFLQQGLFIMGLAGTAVDFRDANRTILIQNTKKVISSFNGFEIRNASSRVDWTSITILALGTVSKGTFVVTDNADVNFDKCTFTDMSTFGFLSNSTILNTTFRRCALITTGGGTFTGCLFDAPSGSIGVTASSPANAALISDCSFVSDGTGHGLEITGTAANMTLTNVDFSGYAASDGSTGNEAVYVNIASGSMNLTISGGTVPSIRTAGAAVTVISGAVSATVTVTTATGTAIQSAQVLVKASNGTGPFPFDETVTITNSGTTATVTHTAHGMATNDKVVISGASHLANNGIFSITVTGVDSYTYTMGSTPGSNPTGTIKSTYVALSGTTDVNGQITMSRVFGTDQPVTGWARKSSGAPFYKTGPINGTIDSATGASLSAVLVLDE